MSKSAVLAMGVILGVLIIVVGIFIVQNQRLMRQIAKDNKDVQVSPSSAASVQSSPLASATDDSKKLTFDQVKEAVVVFTNLKVHEGLIPFMTKPVSVVLYASECCQPMTREEAAEQMDYINDGIPFEFNQNTDRVKNLKAKNAQLAGTYIGISKDKDHLIAYTIDADNKISKIEMSVSWKLYSQ